MKSNIKSLIIDFHDSLYNDNNHRYKSWEHCFSFYKSNNIENNIDKACLHLAFYLASWGMYRGSSFLLWKDYKIHIDVVKKIISKKEIQELDINMITDKELNDILSLSSWIKNWYKNNINSINGKLKKVNVTDTLVTKILLGTLGCIPAYDRYFIDGMRASGIKYSKLSLSNFRNIVAFYKTHIQEFNEANNIILEKSNIEYPPMKLLDMYFWEIGAKNDN